MTPQVSLTVLRVHLFTTALKRSLEQVIFSYASARKGGGWGLSDRDPPWQRPSWTKTLSGQRPARQRPPWIEIPQTETTLDKDPLYSKEWAVFKIF